MKKFPIMAGGAIISIFALLMSEKQKSKAEEKTVVYFRNNTTGEHFVKSFKGKIGVLECHRYINQNTNPEDDVDFFIEVVPKSSSLKTIEKALGRK